MYSGAYAIANELQTINVKHTDDHAFVHEISQQLPEQHKYL